MAIAHERPPPAGWERNRIVMSTRFAYPHSGEEKVNRGATAEDQAGRDYPFPGFILIRESRHIQGSICDECDVQQHGVLLRFSAFNAIRFLMNSTLCVSAVAYKVIIQLLQLLVKRFSLFFYIIFNATRLTISVCCGIIQLHNV